MRLTPWVSTGSFGSFGNGGGATVALVRVLIVDDQELFRKAASAVVRESEGFVLVGSVATGEESIPAAQWLRADLVLMDVSLPGIDGFESTRRLRARGAAPVVVLLSTHDAGEFGDDVHECGATAYLAKSALGPETLASVWASSA
jgi:DNA-binding NarL/FixJ family response regulator